MDDERRIDALLETVQAALEAISAEIMVDISLSPAEAR